MRRSRSPRPSKNPLEYRREHQQKFYCGLNFFWYPFDTLECGMRLKIFESMSDSVTLQPGFANFSREANLFQFTVIKWDISKRKNHRIVEAKLTYQRNYFNHFATISPPCLCDFLIDQCTVYFKQEHFKAQYSCHPHLNAG